MASQTNIKEELGSDASVSAISKRSAELWKNLPPQERAHWDEVAAKDKARYNAEKQTYTGPYVTFQLIVLVLCFLSLLGEV
jgi:hypothetical protein